MITSLTARKNGWNMVTSYMEDTTNKKPSKACKAPPMVASS